MYPDKGLIEFLLGKNKIEELVHVESSQFHSPYHFLNAFDYHNSSIYASQEIQNSWLKITLLNMSVTITAYRIRSADYGLGSSHLKGWTFYGSEDNVNWFTIDSRSDITSLNGNLLSQIFYINNPVGPFRHFMLSNTTTFLYQGKIMLSEFDIYDLTYDSIVGTKIHSLYCERSISFINYQLVLFTLIK